MKKPPVKNGLALISALMIIAVAASIMTRLFGDNMNAGSRTALLMHLEQARHIALAGELLAIKLLESDDNSFDHNGESWAKTDQVFQIGQGTLRGRVSDLQGRINLNGLWKSGKLDKGALSRLERLIFLNDGEPSVAVQMAEWTNKNVVSLSGASGDVPYLSQQPAYVRSRQSMIGASEFRLLGDVDAGLYRSMAPDIVALGERVLINVNTASYRVLMCLSPLINLQLAQSLIEKREKNPFESESEFMGSVKKLGGPLAAQSIKKDVITVKSDYFLIELDARFGSARSVLKSIVRRSEKGKVTIILRSEAEI